MGHKAHPIGLRLGIHRKWNSSWFFESKNYPKFIHLNLNIEKFFKGFLYFYGIKTLLLKTQLIKLASNQIFIFIFYYRFRRKLKKSKYKPRLKKWKLNLEEFLREKPVYQNFANKAFFSKPKQQLSLKKILKIENQKNIIKNFLLSSLKIKKIFFFKIIAYFLKKNVELKNFLLYKKIFFQNKIDICKKLRNLLQIQKNFFSYLKFFFKPTKILTPLINKRKLFFNFWQKNILNLSKIKYFIKSSVTLKKNLQLFFFTLLNKLFKKFFLKNFFYKTIFLKKFLNIKKQKTTKNSKKKKWVALSKQNFVNKKSIKNFLSKITNLKIKLIFINTLSFTKFFYIISENKKKKNKEKYNVFKLQKIMLSKFKYNAIFIKDFIHLTFINVLLKNPLSIVKFIAEQFKRLPKNRKQLKLLTFINQSLKILCQQRKEFLGFKFQLKGRLNRRNRTHRWNFQKGILPIQTYKTRVEFGYSEGFTRSGLIGIKLWFFYKKNFKNLLKKKFLQYFCYSKYKKSINKTLPLKKTFFLKKKDSFKNSKFRYQNIPLNKQKFFQKNFSSSQNSINQNVKTKSTKI